MAYLVFLGLSWICFLIGLIRLFPVYAPTLRARKLYGGLPFSLMRQMISYTSRSPSAHIIKYVKIFILFWIGLELLHFAHRVPVPPRVFLIGVGLFLFQRLLLLALPPSVLFLSSSSDIGAKQFAQLSRELWPYRAIALLRPLQSRLNTEELSWFSLGFPG